MPCLIKPDMHHAWLCIMPCLCLCIYHVVCFFPVLLLSSDNFAIVRISSTTLVRLLHGLVLLPSGISGKMTVTLDITTIIAMLVASYYRFAVLPITCSSSLPIAMSASNLFTFPSKPLLGYVTALLSPSYNVVSCRWSWRLPHGGQDYVWDITISLILLMHLYTW